MVQFKFAHFFASDRFATCKFGCNSRSKEHNGEVSQDIKTGVQLLGEEKITFQKELCSNI